MLLRRLIMPTKPCRRGTREKKQIMLLHICRNVKFTWAATIHVLLFIFFLFFSFSEWWKWFTVTHAVPHYFSWHVGWENQWEDLEQGTKTVVYALFMSQNPPQNLLNCPAGWQCPSWGITPQICQRIKKLPEHCRTPTRILIFLY